MPILGIETLVYGVEDLDQCTRFFDDFGLVQHAKTPDFTHYRLDQRSNVILRKLGDPALPEGFAGSGVKEIAWGVDTQESLDILAARLEAHQSITRSDDGTVRTRTPTGMQIALRVWEPKRVVYAPDPLNSPGNPQRLNVMRKWKTRARPKTITHTVYTSATPKAEFEWYRDMLNFRMSDEQIGIGFYMRCDGAIDHHNLFVIDLSFGPLPKFPIFHHTNFGVEDIDELMIGTNYMHQRGWSSGMLGTGRHRIASALFSYITSPAGGEAEYGADSDYIDDNWVPREWNGVFGTYCWMHKIPEFLGNGQNWEVRFHPDYAPTAKGRADWDR